MKKAFAALLFVAPFVLATDDLDEVDQETLVDIYDYCIDVESDNDSALLECINDDLLATDYKMFGSIDDVRKVIGLSDS